MKATFCCSLVACVAVRVASAAEPEPPWWDIGDGNSALTISSRGWIGAHIWIVNPSTPIDSQQGHPSQFFYRVGTNENETAFDPSEVVSSEIVSPGDRLILTYESAGRFRMTLDYRLRGGGGVYRRADLLTEVTVTNLLAEDLDLHLFMQSLFVLRNTTDDFVQILPNLQGFQTDELTYSMTQTTERPDHVQAGGIIEDEIRWDDGSPSVLTDDFGPAGPTFVSFGYQWDMLIPPGGTRTIHIFQHIGVLGRGANMNFDGDRCSDLNVYWPGGGNWFAKRSWDDLFDGAQNWGWSASVPVPGDYDADGTDDLAVYDPAKGHWYIRKSSDLSLMSGAPIPFGWAASIPAPGDYDGDGTTDLTVYHPAAGTWYVAASSNGTTTTSQWGWDASVPVPGDYDGDGTTDLAVYFPGNATWYIRQSTDGQLRQQQWGWSEVVPTPMDYDGDGKTDIAVYHPASGTWYVLKSSNGLLRERQWGWGAALPVPGDYDGGGKSDLAVYHPGTGKWYIRSTETGEARTEDWGWSEALPTDNQLRINRTFGLQK